MNIGIILAGGRGKRMGMSISKQYYKLTEKMILEFSVETFNRSDFIDEIVFVVAKADIDFFKEQVIGKLKLRKPYYIVNGGAERQDSVWNGMAARNLKDEDIILIHDGARPFVELTHIEACVEQAKVYGAVSLGMPVKDTVKVVDESGLVVVTPDRSKLWLTQTPQAFKAGVLREAHIHAGNKGLTGTDDAGLVEAMGKPVKMIEGSYENIKITTKDDILVAKAYLKARCEK